MAINVTVPARSAALPDVPLMQHIREAVIGDNCVIETPFGARRVTYADYTASGRALAFIEEFITGEVLPRYANTHTESSGTGLQTTRLREDARRIIKESIGGDDTTAVIFAGSGMTGAVDKLIGILNLRLPHDLAQRYSLLQHIPTNERPVVFIGPFEHHSNELPWRESIADVVVIHEDADGHVDVEHLRQQLEVFAHRPLKIGSFSAASNVTGIVTDCDSISELLHQHGALAFWDYAAAGPYIDIDMNPAGKPQAYKDAVVLSPHKFIGGPSTPGVLAIRRELADNAVPHIVGGGTVAYVNEAEHVYLKDVEHREEAGTPAIVESIRAGLIFKLKEAVGVDNIREYEHDFVSRAVAAFSQHPNISVLGNTQADRLSIVSFTIKRPNGKYLHHNFVVALLNDVFGIQSRGGCSCAGPYGHRLLGIDLDRSHDFEREIDRGCEGIKPGWIRVNFNYFISEEVFNYVIQACIAIAENGWKLLPQYIFDPLTGRWRHKEGAVEPTLRLDDVNFGATGMSYEVHTEQANESALGGYLEEAATLFASLPDPDLETIPTWDSETFEGLRWFDVAADTEITQRR
jgi:selenocysteine lyase/cysteine desulfurase